MSIKSTLIKHAPKILTGVGLTAMTAACVIACKKTLDLPDVAAQIREEISGVKALYSEDEKLYKKTLAKAYARAVGKIAKLYGISFGLLLFGAAAIVWSDNLQLGREIAATAACLIAEEELRNYRGNVKERFGDDVDHQMHLGLAEEKKDVPMINEEGEVVKNKKGEVKTEKKDVLVPRFTGHSPYALMYDQLNFKEWEPDAEYNKFFLLGTEARLNDELQKKGHLFLSDVLDALGYIYTKGDVMYQAARDVGWIFDPDHKNPNYYGDSFIDFGITTFYPIDNAEAEAKDAFMNGYEESIIIDLNVSGNIRPLL